MPDIWYDVDVALSEVPVNLMPLIDDTTFKDIEDAVAYNAAGMALRWHFVTTDGSYTVTSVTPTSAGTYDWTDQGDSGIYTIEIPASGGASINNDTEGFGWFTGKCNGVLPWRGPTIGFRAASLNNALIDGGTGNIPANVEQFGGSNGTFMGGIPTANVQNLTVASSTTLATGTHNPQSGDAYGVVNHGTHGNSAIKTQAAAIEADTQDIQSRIPAALVNSRMDCTIDGTGMENGAVDAILNRDASGSTTNSTLGAIINDLENGGRLDLLIDAILEDTGTTLQAELDGIQADTEDIQSRLPAALTGGGNMKVDVLAIDSGDPTDAIRAAILTDGSTTLNSTNLNTLASHDPGETIMGATDTVVLTDGSLTAGKTDGTFVDEIEAALSLVLDAKPVTDFTAVPSGTPTWSEALGMLVSAIINRIRSDRIEGKAYLHDSDNNVIGEATISDDGNEFIRTKFGPPS